MKCKTFQNLILLFVQNELEKKDRIHLEDHLAKCTFCSRVLEQERALMNLVVKDRADVPESDWEKSWQRIFTETRVEKRNKIFLLPYLKKWRIQTSVVTFVFIIGILVGKFIFFPPQTEEYITTITPIQRYVGNIQPVLIDFINKNGRTGSKNLRESEKEILRDMLIKTRLLKKRTYQTGNVHLQLLLDDLELILIEISNIKPGDKNSAARLKEMIRGKDLKFRINTFNNGEIVI